MSTYGHASWENTSEEEASLLITYDSGISKTQIDYCLVRRGQRNFSKNIEALPREEYHLVYAIGMQC